MRTVFYVSLTAFLVLATNFPTVNAADPLYKNLLFWTGVGTATKGAFDFQSGDRKIGDANSDAEIAQTNNDPSAFASADQLSKDGEEQRNLGLAELFIGGIIVVIAYFTNDIVTNIGNETSPASRMAGGPRGTFSPSFAITRDTLAVGTVYKW